MKFLDMLRVAGTLRMLVIAGFAFVIDKLNLQTQFPDAGHMLDQILTWIDGGAQFVQIAAISVGAWWRVRRPQPSLTQKAADIAKAVGASAKEVVPAEVLKANAKAAKASGALAHWLVSIVAGLLALLVMGSSLISCTGTRAAYKAAKEAPAAELLERLAQVTTEHYNTLQTQAADLAALGLTSRYLDPLKAADAHAAPIMVNVTEIAEAYQHGRTAETEADLDAALKDAAAALSRFTDAINSARANRSTTGAVLPPRPLQLAAAL